jgi:hypothetical protein
METLSFIDMGAENEKGNGARLNGMSSVISLSDPTSLFPMLTAIF